MNDLNITLIQTTLHWENKEKKLSGPGKILPEEERLFY